ncbi:MAG: glutaredoxin [Patescibacteria group bacterium]|nr:glutaredoxin [Patescibacteria group bacterium]
MFSFLKRNFLILILSILCISPLVSFAEPVNFEAVGTNLEGKVDIYLFERDGCSFCAKEMDFFEKLALERSDFNLIVVDIEQEENRRQFDLITQRYNLPKVTPITIVGEHIFQGFESESTTGQEIINFIEQSKTGTIMDPKQSFDFKVPFFGVIDSKDFSLFSLTTILGLVDGFNPCAMWVLMTFLLILWQVKDKKKMFQVAGLFILAEAIMYWLILNFWFKTWDFIGLDEIITPLIGLLAIGAGVYFLYRYWKNRGQLVCDTDVGEQSKIENKIQKLVNRPLTIITTLGIIGVALSVNVIEFACSIGIPQAFTKILELNNLNLITEQFYIFLYTLSYMIDDFLIFGLALYGFSKFYAVGQKYSNLSSLIGGMLMLILGVLLLFAPNLLVF